MSRGGYFKCKGKCETLRTGIKPNYDLGDKNCRKICVSVFRNYLGVVCPCCGAKLAYKSHKSKHRAVLINHRHRMPNDIDFQNMPLPELMIKYPRIRDRY